MPDHNVLLGIPVPGSTNDSVVTPGRAMVFGLGPVHLTVIGLVVFAVAGLVMLRKAGFHFSVTVGGR